MYHIEIQKEIKSVLPPEKQHLTSLPPETSPWKRRRLGRGRLAGEHSSPLLKIRIARGRLFGRAQVSLRLGPLAGLTLLAAARSRRGSDSLPGCHSLPRRRFASLHYSPAGSVPRGSCLVSLRLRSRCGSDSPPDCHSPPRRRCATPALDSTPLGRFASRCGSVPSRV